MPLAPSLGAVVAVAAHQPDGTVGDNRHQPVPVVLDLMQPTVAIRRLSAGRDDLEADGVRYLSPHRRWGHSDARHGVKEMWLEGARLPSLITPT